MGVYSGTDMDGTQANGGRERGPSYPRASDLFEVIDVKKRATGKGLVGRPVGAVFALPTIWARSKPNDPNSKGFSIPVFNFNPKTGEILHNVDNPWLELIAAERERAGKDKGYKAAVRMEWGYYFNFLPRDGEDAGEAHFFKGWNKEEEQTGFKDIANKKSASPYFVVKLPVSAFEQMVELKAENIHEVDGEEREFSLLHPDYGSDVSIRYNPDAKTAAAYYRVSMKAATPLNKDEYEALAWDLSLLYPEFTKAEIDQIKASAENYRTRLYGEERSSSGGRGRSRDADDGFDDDAQAPRRSRGDIDDDAPPPRRGRNDDDDPPARSRNRDDDEPPRRGRNDDDEPPSRSRRDIDDEPPSRSRRDEPPARGGRGSRDADDSRDDPPPRCGRNDDDEPPSRSRRNDDDEPPARGNRGRSADRDEPPARGGRGKPDPMDDDIPS